MLYSFSYTKKEQKKYPLMLQIAGISHTQDPVVRPRGIQPWQWFYCVQGCGEVTLNGRKGIVRPGECFYIPSYLPHIYRGVESPWILHITGFGGEIASTLTAALDMDRPGIYHLSGQHFFPDFAELLRQKIESGSPTLKSDLSKICYSFLLDLSAIISTPASSVSAQGDQLSMEIISYLEAHLSETVSLDDLAASLGKTKEYLCTHFKNATGRTIISQLTEIRIARARVLLLNFPHRKVSEIARECGFSTPSYFGAKFRAYCQMTPEQYRLSQLRMNH